MAHVNGFSWMDVAALRTAAARLRFGTVAGQMEAGGAEEDRREADHLDAIGDRIAAMLTSARIVRNRVEVGAIQRRIFGPPTGD